MLEPLLYLQAMAAAAIVSTTFVLAMVALRRPANTTWLNLASVLGVGLGLVTGYYMLSWRLVWPPINGLDRFLTIVVPATLGIELIAGFVSMPRWIAWFLRLSLAMSIPRILLHGSVYLVGNHEPLWQAIAAMTVCAPLLAVVWGLLSWLSQRSPRVSIPVALFLSTLSAGLTVMMAGYIKGGVAAFPLAAILVAASLWIRPVTKHCATPACLGSPAVLGVGVVGLFSLLLIGNFFGRVSTVYGLAMLLTPLLCWATEMPLLRRRQPWVVGSIGLVLVAIPLLLVLTAAKRDFDRDFAPLLGKVKSSTRGR